MKTIIVEKYYPGSIEDCDTLECIDCVCGTNESHTIVCPHRAILLKLEEVK